MTQCIRQPLLFSSIIGKKIVADFNGGDITSDGGLPLLREVDRKIGLIDAINKAVDDPRCQSLIEHDQRTILTQRILARIFHTPDLSDRHADLCGQEYEIFGLGRKRVLTARRGLAKQQADARILSRSATSCDSQRH